jgi:quercetin dioxygenase-like cupin family protein
MRGRTGQASLESPRLTFDEFARSDWREAMKLYRWSEIPAEQVNDLASRQMIHAQTMSVVRREFSKGAVTRLHQHAEEQISMVERGKLKFVVESEEEIVAGGEAFVIPPNAAHSVEALEDTVVMDLFSKPRA